MKKHIIYGALFLVLMTMAVSCQKLCTNCLRGMSRPVKNANITTENGSQTMKLIVK